MARLRTLKGRQLVPQTPIRESGTVRLQVVALQDIVCDRATPGTSCSVHASGRCPAFPIDRRYCEYRDGPAGWSHAAGDPFEVAPEPGTGASSYRFLGCRDEVADGASLAWRIFVIRHELEHDKQRWCTKQFDAITMVRLFILEYRANVAAWRAVREIVSLRRVRAAARVAAVDAAALAFAVVLVTVLGARLSQLAIFLGFLAVGLLLNTRMAEIGYTVGASLTLLLAIALFAMVVRRYT